MSYGGDATMYAPGGSGHPWHQLVQVLHDRFRCFASKVEKSQLLTSTGSSQMGHECLLLVRAAIAEQHRRDAKGQQDTLHTISRRHGIVRSETQ